MKEANIKQAFLKYVSFNIIGMLGLSCYILADTFFVARGVGADGLTALNLAIPIYSFMQGLGLMLGMGGATRFVISRSEKVFTQGVYYTLLSAFVFVMAGIFFSSEIATLLGADGDTLENTSVYLKIMLCFSPMFLFNNVIICFVRNDGKPKLAMLSMLIGSLVNIVLDYIFIFPLGMGMMGAAFATGVSPVVSLCILSSHFIKKENTFTFVAQRLQLRTFADIASLGVSALITEFSSGIVIILFNFIILNLEGNIGVAAYGIIANIALVIIAIFTGISQGMQPILSFCHREGKRGSVRQVMKYGFVTAISIAVFVYVVSWIFAEAIVVVFNKDDNLRLSQIAVKGLRIYFTTFAFSGINILCATYFSAVDNPKNAFVISILRGFIVIVPAAFILSGFFGINGVWVAMPVTELMVLLIAGNMMKKAR